MTETPMAFHLERLEDGVVRLRIVREDRTAGEEHLLFDSTIHMDETKDAMNEVLRLAFGYLKRTVDL